MKDSDYSKFNKFYEQQRAVIDKKLANALKKRKPEWIMNMMLNPVEMTQKDPEAKRLYQEYLLQMTFQDVTEDDARAILEYFRSKDQ